jgi:hypothetical protein
MAPQFGRNEAAFFFFFCASFHSHLVHRVATLVDDRVLRQLQHLDQRPIGKEDDAPFRAAPFVLRPRGGRARDSQDGRHLPVPAHFLGFVLRVC